MELSKNWTRRDAVWLHLRALAVGILAGALAVVFHLALDAAVWSRETLSARVSGRWPIFGALVVVGVTAINIVVAVWLVRWLAPEATGSGISEVERVLQRGQPIRWLPVSLVKFASGVLGIGAGLALGREGPTVQMGAAMGQLVARTNDLHDFKHRQVIALGAAAGLTGAFNAPLAGMLFFFEELRMPFHPGSCSAALLAVVASDTVCRLVLDQRPALGDWTLLTPPLLELPLFALLGVIAGLAGVLFNRSLLWTLRFVGSLRQRGRGWLFVVAVGLLVGLMVWLRPEWVGSGARLLNIVLQANMVWNAAIVWLALRFLMTVGGYSTGAAGGIFAPLLLMGGLLGLVYHAGLAAVHAPTASVRAFAIVGMAGLFTGVVRAPLTGVLLLIEMAGAYNLLLPLLVACLVAKWTADLLRDTPIYEALQEA